MRITTESRSAYNQALGMTVNQLLFEARRTRKQLGEHCGLSRSIMTRKLRGESNWTAEELSIMAGLFGLRVEDFAPTRTDEGWVPGPYVPGSMGTPCGARTHDLRIKSPQL